MKKNYQEPEIWVEEVVLEGCIAQQISNIRGNTSLGYGGGGSGPARAGENDLWDDENEDEDSKWDQL